MKLSIERGTLLKALAQAQSVVERRNTIPILANVLIEADGNQVSFRATDLDIGDKCLMATGHLGTFKAAYGMCETRGEHEVAIDERTARLLEVGTGDEVWSVAR